MVSSRLPSSNYNLHLLASSGGAIGGLSLAAFICKHTNPDAPVKVDVYESRPEISTRGTGIGIWKRSWQVLQDLGLDKELEKRNIAPPKDGEGMDHSVMLHSICKNLYVYFMIVRGPVFRKSDQPEEGFTFHSHIMPCQLSRCLSFPSFIYSHHMQTVL